MSCLEAGHILSNGLKITFLCFSSAAMSIKSEIPAKIEFSQFFKDNTCAQLATVEPRFNEVAGDRPNLFVKDVRAKIFLR